MNSGIAFDQVMNDRELAWGGLEGRSSAALPVPAGTPRLPREPRRIENRPGRGSAYSTFFQVGSGLNVVMAIAIRVVSFPRSFR
jgi:hypothetical protein